MRITGGDKRGLNLYSPKGLNIRPTSEKIRLAVFNILYRRIEHSVFVDLCCGTGIMAMEALSRGADRAVLVDQSEDSRKTVLRNLEITGFGDRASFVRSDVVAASRRIVLEPDALTIFYFDPPYKESRLYQRVLEMLNKRAPGRRVVLLVEHPESMDLISSSELLLRSHHRYGEKRISLFTSQSVVW